MLTSELKLLTGEPDIHKTAEALKVIHKSGKLSTKCIDLLTKVSKKSTLQAFHKRKTGNRRVSVLVDSEMGCRRKTGH